jgi:hypothetical protein
MSDFRVYSMGNKYICDILRGIFMEYKNREIKCRIIINRDFFIRDRYFIQYLFRDEKTIIGSFNGLCKILNGRIQKDLKTENIFYLTDGKDEQKEERNAYRIYDSYPSIKNIFIINLYK